MTIDIMTLDIMTLDIMTLDIMTLWHYDIMTLWHYDIRLARIIAKNVQNDHGKNDSKREWA